MEKNRVYEIGQAYIRLDIKTNNEFKNAFEQFLLFKGKQYSKQFYNKELIQEGLYFSVELEEGSLKSRLKIFGKIAIGSLIAYGGIRTGIDYIIKDAQTITEHIARDLSIEPHIGKNRIGRVERRLGVPGKIKRLYKDIDKLRLNGNNLSANEQRQVLNRIHRNLEDLVLELDLPEITLIEQYLVQNQIPLPEREILRPQQYAIREEEFPLISERDIRHPRQLPLP
ncbi:hypothetical protein [uncultured Roseivirga sp.]|uniref:hypothetical protein n=1 Tax=uncultured Roseivirga sp. TaxID=543088 RepID=UPI000D7B4517|nr:hypothetical protein [uncultured Roseivirga sp.]PWL32124.1 MAG: hypothetical protein DCO95_02790 [Roseivirga sp. XM-24bin3]